MFSGMSRQRKLAIDEDKKGLPEEEKFIEQRQDPIYSPYIPCRMKAGANID